MPDWLPATCCVDPWAHSTYDKLYGVFCNDIRDANLQYAGKRVWFFSDMEDGKEILFWHLTTRKQSKGIVPRRKRNFERKGVLRDGSAERLPDLRRCERLPWVNPLIHHPQDSSVLAWDYKEGDGTIKTYVWLKEEAFVVVLKRYRNMTRRLVTSFYVDKDYTKQDFERKYACRIQ